MTFALFSTAIGLFLSACAENSSTSKEAAEKEIVPKTPVVKTDLANRKVLTLGSVNEKPSEEIADYLPFMEFLKANKETLGVDDVDIRVTATSHEMGNLIVAGEVDVYIDSPFTVLQVKMDTDCTLLLRRWKKGVGEYRSVIFTRKDSGISDLSGLNSNMISFEEPASTSGFMLPMMLLSEFSLDCRQKNSPGERVGKNHVGYVFSEDDENTMVWVLRGKVAAGAMSEASYLETVGEKGEELKVLEKSFMVPRHIVAVRKDLESEIRDQFKMLLMDMHESEAGKASLKAFERTARFDSIPAPFQEKIGAITTFLENM